MARLETHDTASSTLTKWCPYVFVCCLLLCLIAPHVHADIDVAEYETRSAIRSEQERRHLQQQFTRDREAEQVREQARLAETARLEAERQARLAARPYPERLTEARCTLCHASTHFSNQRHAWLGWTLVVLRMKHLNDAPIVDDEVPVIATYLTETYGAAGLDAAIEYALLPLAGACLVLVVWLGRRSLSWRQSQS